MIVVLRSMKIEWMDSYFRGHGSQLTAQLGLELQRRRLSVRHSGGYSSYFKEDHTLRPTAASLVTWITSAHNDRRSNNLFCAIC